MLIEHINQVEKTLISRAEIPGNSGHSLHKGTPREFFIKEFLQNHISDKISIGTGEIIDCNSKPNENRNQIDIVLYNNSYPKLDFGGGISGFLAESVIATIEVKSVLTDEELSRALNSIQNVKKLKRNFTSSFSTGWIPPGILSFVVAYDGPAKMKTVKGWIDNYIRVQNITMPSLKPSIQERSMVQSPLADAIIALGKGFIQYDNIPLRYIDDTTRLSKPNAQWIIDERTEGNLLVLFSLILSSTLNVLGRWLDTNSYLSRDILINGDFLD
jgi:hypothetical protein